MLNLLRSNRMERLLDELIRLMKTPPLPAMDPEWICVQSQGIRTWLAMEIAGRTGICTNMAFSFPRELVESVLAAVLQEPLEQMKRFRAEHLTWTIMTLLPSFLEKDAFAALRRYLKGDPRGVKRYQLARQIAQTFDEYGIYRWRMLLEWERKPPDAWKIEPEDRWQPILWNAVSSRLGGGHLATQNERFLKTAAKAPSLPPRIFLFGISTLPPLFLTILAHLAGEVDIHLFVLSPSREYWADIRSRKEQARTLGQPGAVPAAGEEGLWYTEGHPLLASLGRLGRDFQQILEATADYHEPDTDLHHDPASPESPTVLSSLQSDILHLRSRGLESDCPRLPVLPQDRSIAIHSCHSPVREIQVLKDQLLDLFQRDETLNPHDIIVMTPDIEAYAPYIEAVFGAQDAGESPIPFGISDRSVQREAQVAEAFAAVLRMAQSRLTAQEVIDLLSLEPVRRRYRLSATDLQKLQGWVLESGIRWGIDPDHRRLAGQPAFYENTWRFGLDRLLLGYALPENGADLFEGVLPLEGIEGQDADIFSRFVEFCETLFQQVREFQRPRTTEDWHAAMVRTLDAFIEATPASEAEHQLIRNVLGDWLDQTRAAGFQEAIPIDLVVEILEERLAQTRSTLGFLKGGVTFCNLVPMRSIPFKVVCLMGMNDQGFPRRGRESGFSLMPRHPQAGDRSLRIDDRFLFLEALLSARRHFIITYVGRHIQTNEAIPPSAVVCELIDAINEGFAPPSKASGGVRPPVAKAADALTLVHPLQPFSARYFQPDAPLFSYSTTFFQGARALAGERAAQKPFFQAPLAVNPNDFQILSLAEIIRFFRNPAAYFLTRRLDMHLRDESVEIKDREPLFLDRLEAYPLGSALLEAGISGAELCRLYPFMCAQGVLPPGIWGRCSFDDLVDRVDPVCRAVLGEACERPLAPFQLDLKANPSRLVGCVDGLYAGFRLAYRYAAIKPRDRLSLWIHHLALNALPGGELPRRSILIGRRARGVEKWSLGPVADTALPELERLITLFHEGQGRPLPFFPETSHAFAKAWYSTEEGPERKARAMAAARKAWNSAFAGIGEADHPAVQQVFGHADPLAGEDFQTLALQIFTPMFNAEAEI